MELQPYWYKEISKRTFLSQETNRALNEFIFGGDMGVELNPENLIQGEQSILLMETLMWLYSDKLDTSPKYQSILYQKLGDEPKPSSTEHIAWVERMFLAGLNLLRQGQKEKARDFWRLAKQKASSQHVELLIAREKIMDGVFQMNLGHYRMALEVLEDCINKHVNELDLYMLIHAYAACAISNTRLGRFEQTERIIEMMHGMLDGKSPALTTRVYRLKVLNLVQKGDFGLAKEFLVSILSDDRSEGLVRAYFMQQLLSYQISRNQIVDANHTIETLKGFLDKAELSRTVINLNKEEAELFIRLGKPQEALNLLEPAFAQATNDNDCQDQFSLGTLKSQALSQLGKNIEALKEINKAITLAEEKDYLPGLVVAYFHAVGIAFKLEDENKFQVFAGKGQALAVKLKMDVRSACFEYLQMMAFGGKPKVKTLLTMVNHPNFGPDVDFYLESYGIVQERKVNIVSEGGKTIELSEPEMRKRITSAPGVYYFSAEGFVVHHDQVKTQVVELPDDPTVVKPILALIRKGKDGATLEEIYKLGHENKYDPEKHLGHAKGVLQKMRANCLPIGFKIAFQRSTNKYILDTKVDFFEVTWH